jgi:arsenite methyltransferase
MTQLNEQQVKEIVQERYAEVARGASSCCEPSCCSVESSLYTIADTEGLPTEAVMASAGCGNPAALASLNPGETVVDFGSGGGIDCFLAARAVGPQGKVIGIDMTPDMVNLAKDNARKLNLSNVEFHLTEMEHTPIPDDSVDVIISNCVINLAPDKDAVFREVFRILRPGGRMAVSDMVLTEELPDDVAADPANWVACLSGAELKPVYLERLEKAGFVKVEVVSESPFETSKSWGSRVHSMNIQAQKPV